MDNLQMIIIVGWIVIVIVLAVVMRIVSEKRRKKMSGMRIKASERAQRIKKRQGILSTGNPDCDFVSVLNHFIIVCGSPHLAQYLL